MDDRHAPSPWQFAWVHGLDKSVEIESRSGEPICRVYWHTKQEYASAALIVQAPLLLEILREARTAILAIRDEEVLRDALLVRIDKAIVLTT